MRTVKGFCLLFILFAAQACIKFESKETTASNVTNEIHHAKGLAIFDYGDYSVINVNHPWPGATQNYTYVLKKSGAVIPDSLKNAVTVTIPLKTIVVTSTTHIPSLEMLGVENSLVGFPNLDYISSDKIRARIDAKKIKELGNNQSLNTEVTIDLNPDAIIGYGIDNNNPALDNLQKSGLKILLNGDWNEQTPLGKAEWIKLFGVLYDKKEKADSIFSSIEKEYNSTMKLAAQAAKKPTALSGAMYENKWYLPQGQSWGAQMIAQAGGNYLWQDSPGTGSLSLSFETVLEKAQQAEIWIGPGQFTSLKDMTDSSPHYAQFSAYKNKKIFSFSTKKGKTGGILYYELAPNRPDLVLKDLVKIFHPELLPNHQPFFFEQLQ